MQHIELSKGIFLNQLSNRIVTITSKLPNASSDWRISYFGFEKWHEATKFVFRLKRLREDESVRCESRRSKRLTTKFEVKVWTLTKEEVRTLWCELEGHSLTTKQSHIDAAGGIVYDVFLNHQRILKVHENRIEYLKEFQAKLTGLSHDDARRLLTKEFLFPDVKEA